MQDVRAILDPLKIPDSVKADAWDAVAHSATPDELKSKLDRLPIENDTRAALWEAKGRAFVSGSGATSSGSSTGNVVTDAIAGIGSGVLSTIFHGGDLIRRGLGMERVIDRPEVQQLITPPDTIAGKAGKFAEQAAEFFAPSGVVGKASKASVLSRAGAEAVAAGGVAAVQTGGDPAATATTAALGAAGPVAGKMLSKAAAKIAQKASPSIESAMEFVEGQGVPLSAATRTGNRVVQEVQRLADATPLGTSIATAAEEKTTQGMRGLAGKLAGLAHESPVVPEQAGASVRGAIANKSAQHAANAETSYGVFREIEAKASSIRRVQTGTKEVTGIDPATYRPVTNIVPVIEDIPMPVDLREFKAELSPIYEDMSRWMEPARRNASQGYQAMKSILDGPDVIPASQAEAGLGGLKQLAREASGRNSGLAKFMVPKLQQTIDSAVGSIDEQALRELQAGRTEAAAQFGTQAVLEQLRHEPVQAFGQLTYAKDAGVDLLRQVAREAPSEMSKVGRAYLEQLFDRATVEGGFDKAGNLFNAWQSLGPQTKKILFQNPKLIDDLDKFFLAAKKISESPKAGGNGLVSFLAKEGGVVLAITHPLTGLPYIVGGAGISRLLHSPAGARALTEGVSLPSGAREAGSVASQILKVAGRDATRMPDASNGQ